MAPRRRFPRSKAGLSAPAQALLHEIVAADEMIDGERALEQAQACLRRLETDWKKRQVDELRGRVKAAEREGRVEEARSIIAELERLRKHLAG